MYQQFIGIGNVGNEPQLSYTPQGVAVCKFNLAINKVTGKGDTRKEKTTWLRVSVWRERAETAQQYIHKGSKIMVIGEVEVNAYIDKDGKAAATLELTAFDFKFLDTKAESEGGGQGRQQQTADKPPAGGRRTTVEDPNDIPF